jgi:osmotically-inducible protein OsmY
MDDRTLKQIVEEELEWEPSIDANDIGVGVENGIVHLTGYVATYSQKIDAEAAVKRVKGVRGYVEDLQIRPFAQAHSDESLALCVANVIDWDSAIPRGAIKAKVEKGFVTLTGEVAWQYQRAAAENVVRPLHGVRGVISLIDLKPRIEAKDVKKRIEQALLRQSEFDAGRIRVSVDGDKVRLDGKVRAWFERDLAERAAWAAPGVKTVEDNVTVGV